MAITKRTRFEILRRDNNTCQYCGEKAPDVVLHIDHVIPVALGGSDRPDNLLTACKDCNAGKTSIQPDSPLVASVSMRSAEWAIANANRNAHIENDLHAAEQYQEDFLSEWRDFRYTKGIKRIELPLPSDWRSSLTGWWKTGVPPALISSAIQTAMGAQQVTADDTFRYFCGVVWRTLDDYDQRYSEQTAEARVYSDTELEEYGIAEWQRGRDRGERAARALFASEDVVANFIDRNMVGV